MDAGKNQEQLLEQLHKEDRFDEIIAYILSLPDEEVTFEMAGRLASAYNNTEQYAKALEILDKWTVQGENDSLWHYRRGYACFYLPDYEEAEKAFNRAFELNQEDSDCLYFLALIYGFFRKDETAYADALKRLKELNPELYRAEFGETDCGETQTDDERTYIDLWRKLATPSIRKWYEYKNDWSRLDEMEQQMVAFTIFIDAMENMGFLHFFCNTTNGYEAFSYVVKAIKHCAGEPFPYDIEDCYEKASDSVVNMYRIVAPYMRNGVPIWDIPRKIKKSERDQIATNEDIFKQKHDGLTAKLYTCFYNEQTVVVSRPFSTDYRLCYAMLSEYPFTITQRITVQIRSFIKWLEAGCHTYREVQRHLDDLTVEINRMKQFCEQEGHPLDETARYSIAETIEYILRWFAIDIDIAYALRLREW